MGFNPIGISSSFCNCSHLIAHLLRLFQEERYQFSTQSLPNHHHDSHHQSMLSCNLCNPPCTNLSLPLILTCSIKTLCFHLTCLSRNLLDCYCWNLSSKMMSMNFQSRTCYQLLYKLTQCSYFWVGLKNQEMTFHHLKSLNISLLFTLYLVWNRN